MKIFGMLMLLLSLLSAPAYSQLFVTQSGEISFFSETPMENISAVNKSVGAMLNTTTNELVVSVKMTAFDFPNKLMQEHFNENYVESEKYPVATFKAKLVEPIDFTKNGVYTITARGPLMIHGVAQNRELKGKLTVENEKLTLLSNFDVKLVDHKIDVPTLVFSKIAEVISVKSKYTFTPYVKRAQP